MLDTTMEKLYEIQSTIKNLIDEVLELKDTNLSLSNEVRRLKGTSVWIKRTKPLLQEEYLCRVKRIRFRRHFYNAYRILV